mgnify:CR=1 FL=1
MLQLKTGNILKNKMSRYLGDRINNETFLCLKK